MRDLHGRRVRIAIKRHDFHPVTLQFDGNLFARGSADNKGSMLSRYCAIDAYQKVYGKLPVNIRFLTEGGEEIGSPGLMDFIKQNPDKIDADGIIWEGGSKDINDGPLQIALGRACAMSSCAARAPKTTCIP